MSITQDHRIAMLETPLGKDKLLLRSATVSETLARPFRIELDLLSEDPAIDFAAIIGKTISLKLEPLDGTTPRYFNGHVSRFSQTDEGGTYTAYRATIVPWLWLLTRTADCQIFQQLSVPDIIKKVFSRYTFAHFSDSLNKSYSKREFCVQYRETAFNFVSRLMESEGIYYYFQHRKDKHTLVLCDAPASHEAFPNHETLRYHPEHAGEAEVGFIRQWLIEQELQTGKYVLKDFDFKTPTKGLQFSAEVARDNQNSKLEVYDYPSEYVQPHGLASDADGKHYAHVRIEELQSQFEVVSGQADSFGIATGCTFTMEKHPRDDQNRKYLVASSVYQISSEAGSNANQEGGGGNVYCHFTAIPAAVPFRPARLTSKPIVQGLQTAIVVGPAGEEIWTDKYGRVKLHFHWDRLDKLNENSSCWVRVAQSGWAGAKWGGIHVPRMGQEVIVEFVEGDPDRPLITGRVYNNDQMPPYELPANMTQSGIKSRSTKKGGPDNFNEIRMEDKKGSEQLYIHAEKNEDIVVENDKTENVGHDETISIGHDRTETVGHDETITVQNDRTETVMANEKLTVMKDRTRTVNQNESITVALLRTHTVGVNEAITVGAAQEITVGANQATTVGANQENTIGANQANTIGSNRSTTVGKDDTLDVAKKLTITAGEEITITTGSASIHMKKDGTITIKGKDITIDGSGELVVKASKNVTIKGQKILQN